MILTPLNCYPLIEAVVPDIIHVLRNRDANLCSVTVRPWICTGAGLGQRFFRLNGIFAEGLQQLQRSQHLVTVTVQHLQSLYHSPNASQLRT